MPVEQKDIFIVQKVLGNARVPIDELNRIIAFYHSLIEVERLKEPDIDENQLNSLPLITSQAQPDQVLIPTGANVALKERLAQNKSLTFPKDLYIGMTVTVKERANPCNLLCTVVEYKDFKDKDLDLGFQCSLTDFRVDSRYADALQLTDENLEEINAAIARATCLSEIEAILKANFGDETRLAGELKLDLSSKKISLSQISSELNAMEKSSISDSHLLKSFLLWEDFDNELTRFSAENIIRVSDLDASQAEAVAHALSNRFTVITGAPGTGKTQVILNIIANALIRDKKALVASKNNMAVDNVKTKFDIIDPNGYLLRFGNRLCIQNESILAMDKLLGQADALADKADPYPAALAEYKATLERIDQAKRMLAQLEALQQSIAELQKTVRKCEAAIPAENEKFESEIENRRRLNSPHSKLEGMQPVELDRMASQFRQLLNRLEIKYSGLTKCWHNLFSKKKDARDFLSAIESLHFDVKQLVREECQKMSVRDFANGDEIIHGCKSTILEIEKILKHITEIKRMREIHDGRMRALAESLDHEKAALYEKAAQCEALSKEKGAMLKIVEESQNSKKNVSIQLVRAKIGSVEKGKAFKNSVTAFKSYLPDRIPWQEEEKRNFVAKTKDFLNCCKLDAVTNLSVKNVFPCSEDLFDILIIDEASQCDVASALPLMLRARQVVIIGDPLQLRHITSVTTEEENLLRPHFGLEGRPYLRYANASLWDFANEFIGHAKTNQRTLSLDNHYRCHRHIISYSNAQFYGRILGKPLNILTDESKMAFPVLGVRMINVRGQQEEHKNVNVEEVNRCVRLAQEISTVQGDFSIGIVTPFRDQADAIKLVLPINLKNAITVSTAHGFQGDEKDVMIYSLVVTDNSPARKIKWIDEKAPNLVNVAVTRAKQVLYIVGNAEYIKAHSSPDKPLGYLVRYAQKQIAPHF